MPALVALDTIDGFRMSRAVNLQGRKDLAAKHINLQVHEDLVVKCVALEALVEELEFQIAESNGFTLTPPAGLHIEPQPFRLINYLTGRPGRVCTYDQITAGIAKPREESPSHNSMKVQIHKLRKLLLKYEIDVEIVTKWGVGMMVDHAGCEVWNDLLREANPDHGWREAA